MNAPKIYRQHDTFLVSAKRNAHYALAVSAQPEHLSSALTNLLQTMASLGAVVFLLYSRPSWLHWRHHSLLPSLHGLRNLRRGWAKTAPRAIWHEQWQSEGEIGERVGSWPRAHCPGRYGSQCRFDS